MVSLWKDFGSNPSRMGVSIEQYRQRIGCFARVASVLSSFKVNSNTCQKQSKTKHYGTALQVIIRYVHVVCGDQNIDLRHCKHLLQQPILNLPIEFQLLQINFYFCESIFECLSVLSILGMRSPTHAIK